MSERFDENFPFASIESGIREMIFSYMVLGHFPPDWPFEAYNDYLARQNCSLRCTIFSVTPPIGGNVSRELRHRVRECFPDVCIKTYEGFIVCLSFSAADDGIKGIGALIRGMHTCDSLNVCTGERIHDLRLIAEEYRHLCDRAEHTGDNPDRANQILRLYALEGELLDNILAGDTENTAVALDEIARVTEETNHHNALSDQGYFCFLWRYIDRAIYRKTGLRRTTPEKLTIDSRIQATETAAEAAKLLGDFITGYVAAQGLVPIALSGSHKMVQRAKEYVTANCANDVSLEAVAEQVGLSSFYLSKLFKKEGINYKDFVIKVRMELAKTLITQGNLNVSEVARAVGYQNANYFGKAFRSYYGVTARDLRLWRDTPDAPEK